MIASCKAISILYVMMPSVSAPWNDYIARFESKRFWVKC